VYRCGTGAVAGSSACPTYKVRQSDILPFVLRLLGEEVADITALLSAPPAELRRPHKERDEQRAQTERERAKLANLIAKAEENLLFSEDPRTRKSLDARVTDMRDEMERLDAELAVVLAPHGGYSREDAADLAGWWREFDARAVSIPVSGNLPPVAHFYQDPQADEGAILADCRLVNETLHALGAEVRLRWKTEEYTSSGGVRRRRHVLERGRFRLGRQNGKVPLQYVLEGSARRPNRSSALAISPGLRSRTTRVLS